MYRLTALLILALAATALPSSAQVVQPYVGDLLSPMRLAALPDGALLVAEAGGPTANSGRVSIVDRDGRRATIVDGLPSGLYNNEPSGPAGVLLLGERLFILIGAGNATIPGPAPGSELPNPAPASPLFSAVLLLEFNGSEGTLTTGFTLPPAAHATLAADGAVYLRNARGDAVRVSRFVDFPDTVPEPRPDVPANVRLSNPFGLVGSAAHLDVVDASRNLIFGIDVRTRTVTTLVLFAPVPNRLAPMGPPVVDAVPTSVHAAGDALVVSLLTGFPFAPGAASVQTVNRHDGTTQALLTDLTTVIDTAPSPGSAGEIYVLEYSRNLLAGAPGRLLRFDTPAARPIVISDTLTRPTSLAVDPRSGDLWVAELAGRVVRVLAPR